MEDVKYNLKKHFTKYRDHDVAHVKFQDGEYIGFLNNKHLQVYALSGGTLGEYLWNNNLNRIAYPSFQMPNRFSSGYWPATYRQPLTFYSGRFDDIIYNFIQRYGNITSEQLHKLKQDKSSEYQKIYRNVMDYLFECAGLRGGGTYLPFSPLIRAVPNPIIHGSGLLPDRRGIEPIGVSYDYGIFGKYFRPCCYRQNINLGQDRCSLSLTDLIGQIKTFVSGVGAVGSTDAELLRGVNSIYYTIRKQTDGKFLTQGNVFFVTAASKNTIDENVNANNAMYTLPILSASPKYTKKSGNELLVVYNMNEADAERLKGTFTYNAKDTLTGRSLELVNMVNFV